MQEHTTIGSTNFGYCHCSLRADHKSVIFKKLEKVGEPITVNGKNVQLLKTTIANCDNCAFYKDVNCDFTCYPRKCHGGEDGTYVEIKNKEDMGDNDDIRPYDDLFSPGTVSNTKYLAKEDMEEKKTNFVEAIDALCKRYNMSDGVRTDFMSELKEIIKDKEKCNLKPFNLEAAKAGKPVCTRGGRKARIIYFDAKGDYPIVALIETENGEKVVQYMIDGHCTNIISQCYDDLMMLPEKKEGWVNVYKNQIHDTPESAEEGHKGTTDYIKTIRVEWEE